MNLGDLVRTDANGKIIGLYRSSEKSDQFSVALGFDYYMCLAIGMNFKNARSTLPLFETHITTSDFGLFVQAPLFSILKRARGSAFEIFSGVEPIFNLNFGYCRANLEDKLVYYQSEYPADPLPRNVTLGLSAEIGFAMNVDGYAWKIINVTLAREAEDLLVIRHSDGTFLYQSGLGDISFFRHIVRGDLARSDRATLHEGWEIGLADFIYVRGGSFRESPDFGNRNFSTAGLGLKLAGLVRAIGWVMPELTASTTFSFIAEHVDVSFDHARYTSSNDHPLHGVEFNSLGIVIR